MHIYTYFTHIYNINLYCVIHPKIVSDLSVKTNRDEVLSSKRDHDPTVPFPRRRGAGSQPPDQRINVSRPRQIVGNLTF